uniref:Uncharacterized protein n=1 Tax=Oryza meridionalis TaxID=40149 RepID=A0A0E0EP86_9ORYZ
MAAIEERCSSAMAKLGHLSTNRPSCASEAARLRGGSRGASITPVVGISNAAMPGLATQEGERRVWFGCSSREVERQRRRPERLKLLHKS